MPIPSTSNAAREPSFRIKSQHPKPTFAAYSLNGVNVRREPTFGIKPLLPTFAATTLNSASESEHSSMSDSQ
eukprot:1087791-Rhodomonas_salina.2